MIISYMLFSRQVGPQGDPDNIENMIDTDDASDKIKLSDKDLLDWKIDVSDLWICSCVFCYFVM